MITSLSGEFVQFNASYTHAPELGGEETSIITNLAAHFISKEVLNDQAGRDTILDFLADNVYLMYGEEGAFGVVAHPRSVRAAINTYLQGFLKEENIRVRVKAIKFETKAPRDDWKAEALVSFGNLNKSFESSWRPSLALSRPGKLSE